MVLPSQTKRAGRTLLSRSIAKSSVDKWRKKIEELESDIATVLKQERYVHGCFSTPPTPSLTATYV